MNINRNVDRVLSEVIKGFGIAMGVALAKWLTTLIPLAGFNLNF